VPFTLVVEPQEYEEYQAEFPNFPFLIIPENDKGVTYVRNQILEVARGKELKWIWMMDDDIKSFHLTENSKTIKAGPAQVIFQAEACLKSIPNLAIGAMEYQQYAWAAKKPFVKNSYCDVAAFLNIELTRPLNYRPDCKEDRDFVLQCLALGYNSARSSWTSFSVPKNGSNKGGLQDDYLAGKEMAWSQNMIRLWPGICEMHVKKDGRTDVKIHWTRLTGKKS
jgi:hypothetical protein